MRPWLLLAGLNGLVAVAAGAYGWHRLAVSEAAMRDIFRVGVDYQMWHAMALLGVAWLAERRPLQARIAGWAFSLGIVLFSGTLYVLGLTGEVPLSGAAPIGGVMLMVGWAALAWGALVRN